MQLLFLWWPPGTTTTTDITTQVNISNNRKKNRLGKKVEINVDFKTTFRGVTDILDLKFVQFVIGSDAFSDKMAPILHLHKQGGLGRPRLRIPMIYSIFLASDRGEKQTQFFGQTASPSLEENRHIPNFNPWKKEFKTKFREVKAR